MPYGVQHQTSGSSIGSGQIVSGPCTVNALGILAGSDAATAIFYDGNDATGSIIWALGVAAGLSDGIAFNRPVRCKKGVYVVMTGTSPRSIATIDNPQANHL